MPAGLRSYRVRVSGDERKGSYAACIRLYPLEDQVQTIVAMSLWSPQLGKLPGALYKAKPGDEFCFIAISHCWESREHPDPCGFQRLGSIERGPGSAS